MAVDTKTQADSAITDTSTTATNKRKKNQKSSSDSDDDDNISSNNDKESSKPAITLGVSFKFKFTDEFLAGCVAACINTSALFPINKLIFRQMAGGHGTQIAADQMKQEGLRYLYRGILPPLLQKMVSVSIMFGSYGQYRKWVDSRFLDWHPIANLTLAACLTGTTEAVLTPLERTQMLLQDRKFHKDYKNTCDALVKLRKHGFREYYRGLTCVLVRNGPSNILFFGLRDEIKKLLPRFRPDATTPKSSNKEDLLGSYSKMSQISQRENLLTHTASSSHQLRHKDSMLHDFLTGAILGMFISTLFYPVSVVRTRMQTRAPGTEFLSIVKAFNAIYSERDRKFSRLFHGCFINVLRQFVSWGIINCSYELALDFLRKH